MFSYAGRAYELVASAETGGAPEAAFSDPNGAVACAGCTAGFDLATDVVTIVLPLATLNGTVPDPAPPVGPGGKLGSLNVLAQRIAGAVTPTADAAATDIVYVVPGGLTAPTETFPGTDERGDAVVVAVIDSNVVPYHWDFAAEHMPQHLDGDTANDLPLTQPPSNWLPGFPDPASFKSFEALDLTLAPGNPAATLSELDAADADVWAGVESSTPEAVNYYWMPGTKVIGAIEFGSNQLHGTSDAHGVGVTSVSVGNIHGTCPECLLVFINGGGDAQREASIRWAASQPWIDVVTNSYGINLIGDMVRDGLYFGHQPAYDTRDASMRGQTTFFSAGNGIENAFVVPNSTYTSGLKGPDWMITVGATTPGMEDYTGAGKPVDVSGIGEQYPSAYTATTVSGTGATGFSGTSNATPTVAGTYGRALYQARRHLPGPSRIQENGVVARTWERPFPCGAVRPACELGDGELTASELRTRLLHAAIHRNGPLSVGGFVPLSKPLVELEYLDNGHGVFAARQSRIDSVWLDEVESVVGPMLGRRAALARSADERNWMIVDSFCRQRLWGGWPGGYYESGRTRVPSADAKWPMRSALSLACHAAPPMSSL
jgi:hypothetical protein